MFAPPQPPTVSNPNDNGWGSVSYALDRQFDTDTEISVLH